MKRISLTLMLLGAFLLTNGQKFKKLPEYKIEEAFVEKHIRFLASDALMGRKTGEPGNNAASAYIAEEFRSYGLQPVGGSFFQPIPFVKIDQPDEGTIGFGSEELQINDDFLLLSGSGINIKDAELIKVGYGWVSEDESYDDYEGVDVKGKVVITQMGTPDSKGFRDMIKATDKKIALAKERGVLAMIEIFSIPAPWDVIVKNLGSGKMEIKKEKEEAFTTILVNMATAKKMEDKAISIQTDALKIIPKTSNNVIGFIEGSSPSLKDEYVILTAHYDHIGFREASSEGDDYIFNGARDNAIGVAGLLTAAKALSAKRPERSVVVLAVTGEEMGLLGSGYYVEHPLMPLNKAVFNLNIDGAGYNDVTKITGLGVSRTGAESEIIKGVSALGLTLIDDPVPEMGLFDRSDNVQFAVKGIPAPSFSPGFTSFSDEMMQYYHKEADNPESLDYDYCTKFAKSFAYTARLIANKDKAPIWISGDKYEAAAKALYGN